MDDSTPVLEWRYVEPELRAEAMAAVRAQIARIEVSPGVPEPEVVLHGALGAVLARCDAAVDEPNDKHPGAGAPGCAGCQASVVAGVGFEPTTFRL